MYELNVNLNMGQKNAELYMLQLLPLFFLILCFPTAKFLLHITVPHRTNEIKPDFHQSLLSSAYFASIFNSPIYPFLASGLCQGMYVSTSICLQDPDRRSNQNTPLPVRSTGSGYLTSTQKQLVTSLRPQLWEREN